MGRLTRRRFVGPYNLLLAGALTTAGCASDFDTSRATPARGSLGQELYTMVCDRVGAQALREDVTGASFHAVCHADINGDFADKVDTTKLVPLTPAFDEHGADVSLEQQQKNRAHRIARIEALARRRDDLIAALDVVLADVKLPAKDLSNPDESRSCDAPSDGAATETELRTQLAAMLGRLTDLYDDGTVPNATRAFGRLMSDVESSPDAVAALARFDARRGYRPPSIELGVARPFLSYPRLPELADALLRAVASDTTPLGTDAPKGISPERVVDERTAKDKRPGPAHDALVQLLRAMREELRTATPSTASSAGVLGTTPDPSDALLTRISRPRNDIELAEAILLATDPAFAAPGASPRWVVARDMRGVAKVRAVDGKLPAPFVATKGDAVAQLDDVGRFVTVGGAAPTPFPDPFGGTPATRDTYGRPTAGDGTLYEYIDANATFLASLTRDLVPLLDPDPKHQHETLMDLLAGLPIVAGAREASAEAERAYAGGASVRYRGFRADDSPLLDLVHAIGQVLSAPETEDLLALVHHLTVEHPEVLARLTGAALAIKAASDKHPEVKLPDTSTLWDDLLTVFTKLAQNPGFFESVIRALGDDQTPELAKAGALYVSTRDELTYDRDNLNGLPFNVSVGRVASLVTPVDRSQPDTGWNRSAFQRFLQILHDTKGMSACTKEGAVAHIKWKGLPIDFPGLTAQAACLVLGASPPKNPSPTCGLLRIDNIAQYLLDAVLGEVKLDIRDECLRKLVDSPLTGVVGGADAFLEDVSGIKGWNTSPSVPGIARMTFFDLPHDGSPGDTKNETTLTFFRDLFDPVPSLVCPPLPFTDTDGKKLNLRQCANFKDTLRGRDDGALFPLEEAGFLQSARPLARAFYDNGASLLFADILDVLHLHWGSPRQSKSECDPSAPRTDARWCSQDGAVMYEPIVKEAFESDLFPAMHDAVAVLAATKIRHCDARDTSGTCVKSTPTDGVKVLAEALKKTLDPSRNMGLTSRGGDPKAHLNGGGTNGQVTPIYLAIDALKRMDTRFADEAAKPPGSDRLARWRRARSQLVDQFFAIDGAGATAKFRNPAVAKILPIAVGALRSQLAAHCPDPTRTCTWASQELTARATESVTGPLFAGILDLADAIRTDDAARTELEQLALFLLQGKDADAASTTLTSLVDGIQLLADDTNVIALLRAASEAAASEELDPEGRVVSRGLLLSVLEVLARVFGEVRDPQGHRICSREIDPNRTLMIALQRLVTPPEPGKPAPIEVLADVVADVNRRRPEQTDKLVADDYASIGDELSDFCLNETRGLEQVYEVIRQATRPR